MRISDGVRPEYRDYDIYVYQNNNRILVKKLNHSEKHFSDERLHAQTLQKKGSYWSRHYSDTLFVKQRIFSRYEPIYNAAQTFIGYLRLDVPIKEFTKFVRGVLKIISNGILLPVKSGRNHSFSSQSRDKTICQHLAIRQSQKYRLR